MGAMKKTALHKKKGARKKKKWRAAEGHNEKTALQKKKGAQKKNEGPPFILISLFLGVFL